MAFLRCEDHTGHEVVLRELPRRIVSLVPSQTELLFDLGLDNEIVGVTKFCIHPSEKVRPKEKVGGTKNIREDVIHALAPDLILGNKEENERETIEKLREYCPVWVSDVQNRAAALQMITDVGMLTDKVCEAENLCRKIDEAFQLLKTDSGKKRVRLQVAYIIWKNPYMAVGSDTYINAMLEEAGFSNVFSGFKRYPTLEKAELANYRPDVVLLSSEPYPFSEKHVAEFSDIFPGAYVTTVDGEPFSWYGSRMCAAPAYFRELKEQIFQYF